MPTPVLQLPQHASSLPAHITWMSGYCPVQAEGTVDGLPFYFHARGDRWIFSVAEMPDGDPVDVSLGFEEGYRFERPYGRKGSGDAGWMPHVQARAFIHQVARFYLKQKERTKQCMYP